MKTIFYTSIKSDENADYFLQNKPYKKLLEIENLLYEPNGNIIKEIKDNNGFIRDLTLVCVIDNFSSENGIIRKIGFYNHHLYETN